MRMNGGDDNEHSNRGHEKPYHRLTSYRRPALSPPHFCRRSCTGGDGRTINVIAGCASDPSHVPEDDEAVEYAGDVLLTGCGVEILPQRHVRHILERLALQRDSDLLLRLEIGRIDPLRAQLLDLRAGGPAHHTVLAVAPQEHVTDRIGLV